MDRYFIYAISSYILWGVFPIFWKNLSHIDSLEILAHRILWSSIILSIYILSGKKKNVLRKSLRDKKTILLSLVGAFLLGINWFTYVWAVNNDYIIDASLGYFICPLVSVLLGFLFFNERLEKIKITSICLAFIGVMILTISVGSFPWVAFILSISFGLYGAIKKVTKLEATRSLWIETTILSIPALYFIIFVSGSLTVDKVTSDYILLFLSGFVTFIPLILFSKSASKIKLSTLGFMQYIAPTGQFLIGLFVYKEAFTTTHLISYILIWTGLVLFTYSLYKSSFKKVDYSSI